MPPVKVTYMVDTGTADRRAILDLWRSYLEDRPHEYKRTDRWSAVEQDRWRYPYLPIGFAIGDDNDYVATQATVFEISPASANDSTEFVIRTAFTRPDPEIQGQRVVIMRTYAMRENGRWVLASALPRLTRTWARTAFGSITYVHRPGYTVDTTKARQAVRYIDSLVTAFAAPQPKPITYYLASSAEEVFQLIGIDLFIPGSRAFANVGDYMVFSGVPKIGEFYAHELTHMVLGWRLPDFGTAGPQDEALALWLGGGREMTWQEVKRELAAELQRDSNWTAERLLELRPGTFPHRITATAALLELAHSRGGMPALQKALGAERDGNRYDVIGSVAEALDISRKEVEIAWRDLVMTSR